MRELTSHKVNGCNDALKIEVLDGPGHGGACHNYAISGFTQPCLPPHEGRPAILHISFQNGPIKENGTNGVTHEALLAILIDRLQDFQKGPYANEYNASALASLQAAQDVLKQRTSERLSRGVEGTMQH
jgi:hypothetical protein